MRLLLAIDRNGGSVDETNRALRGCCARGGGSSSAQRGRGSGRRHSPAHAELDVVRRDDVGRGRFAESAPRAPPLQPESAAARRQGPARPPSTLCALPRANSGRRAPRRGRDTARLAVLPSTRRQSGRIARHAGRGRRREPPAGSAMPELGPSPSVGPGRPCSGMSLVYLYGACRLVCLGTSGGIIFCFL